MGLWFLDSGPTLIKHASDRSRAHQSEQLSSHAKNHTKDDCLN